MLNQINTMDERAFCHMDIMPFLRSYYEFLINANSISMNEEMLFVLNWFDDYRSLRFCVATSVAALFIFALCE